MLQHLQLLLIQAQVVVRLILVHSTILPQLPILTQVANLLPLIKAMVPQKISLLEMIPGVALLSNTLDL